MLRAGIGTLRRLHDRPVTCTLAVHAKYAFLLGFTVRAVGPPCPSYLAGFLMVLRLSCSHSLPRTCLAWVYQDWRLSFFAATCACGHPMSGMPRA